MSKIPNTLWLTVSPHLRRFDQRLLGQLTQTATVRCWEYDQTEDEPCCLTTATTLLHDYVKQCDRPLHLMGHGISGLVGLLYARQYPHRVKSLTLISVGANPAISWHSHYYALRQLLPCSRSVVLGQIARLLFGAQTHKQAIALTRILTRDLDCSLAPHSLASNSVLVPGGIEPALLVCHGSHDVIIDPNMQSRWQAWLKPGDRLWSCPEGRHFFHHEYPQQTAAVMADFWQSLPAKAKTTLMS
ncbi:MAG: alpha/beta hydrolase [Leptolyngbya sp. SIO4C5]|nr:alpha/beta hydrolase [Leptolyngbya sp. SIO4C5]